MKLRLWLAGLLLSFGFVNAQETTETTFGKGILDVVAKDSTWSMNFSARMQFLSSFSWDEVDNDFVNPEQSALIRRARLKFNGFAFSPKLKYKIELGLSNRDISGASVYTHNAPRYILDAYIKWNFYQNFELWAGQAKLPGNRERVISSGNMQLVDRSLLNSRFNIDRDIGIQLRHHFTLGNNFIVREIFAISQGEGRNITRGNLGGHQYTSRIELLPFGAFKSKGDYSGSDLKREPKPKLAIGITFDHNNNAVKTRSNLGSYMETDYGLHETNINTWFVDAMYKHNGFSFMGEYAHRDASNPIATNSDGSATGDVVEVGESLNLQMGYLFKNNLELAGRYTNVKTDASITGKLPQHQYTLGVSKFIVGHKLKVQSDISYLDNEGGNNQLMFRLQLDLHF